MIENPIQTRQIFRELPCLYGVFIYSRQGKIFPAWLYTLGNYETTKLSKVVLECNSYRLYEKIFT